MYGNNEIDTIDTKPPIIEPNTSAEHLEAIFNDENMRFKELNKSLILLEKNIGGDRTKHEKKIIANIFRDLIPFISPEFKLVYKTFLHLVNITTKLSIDEKEIFFQAIKETYIIKQEGNGLPKGAKSWLDPIIDKIKKTLPQYNKYLE